MPKLSKLWLGEQKLWLGEQSMADAGMASLEPVYKHSPLAQLLDQAVQITDGTMWLLSDKMVADKNEADAIMEFFSRFADDATGKLTYRWLKKLMREAGDKVDDESSQGERTG